MPYVCYGSTRKSVVIAIMLVIFVVIGSIDRLIERFEKTSDNDRVYKPPSFLPLLSLRYRCAESVLKYLELKRVTLCPMCVSRSFSRD
jgi:hypothetical protein